MFKIKKIFTLTAIFLLSFASFLTLASPAVGATVWTDITLPYTISESGNYRITSAWTGSGSALSVNASNVVVDGQNKLITLNQTMDDVAVTVSPDCTNVVLDNINETGSDFGVYAEGGNLTVQNSIFTNNTSAGIFAYNTSDFTVTESRLSNNSYGFYGLEAHNVFIDNCHVKNNTSGMEILLSGNINLQGMYVNNNTKALTVTNCTNLDVSSSTFDSNENCFIITYTNRTLVKNCEFTNNDLALGQVLGDLTIMNTNISGSSIAAEGFFCDTFTVSNVTILNNENGILALASKCTLRDFEVINSTGFGVYLLMCNSSLVDNGYIANNSFGFYADSGDRLLMYDCAITNNALYGAIVIGVRRSQVESCLLSNNGILNKDTTSGALIMEETNCTVVDNLFYNNSNAILWGSYDEISDNTQVVTYNTFDNNDYTLYFDYGTPYSTSQQFYFSNNYVNDTAYLNPQSIEYPEFQFAPNNAALHLNVTKQLGIRPWIDGPLVGGNFWAHPDGTGFSQTGADVDRDGFIDTPFELYGNASIGVAYDYLPYSLNFDKNQWVPITLPATIYVSGNYKIAEPWTGSGVGLTIVGDDVNVDGQNMPLTMAYTEDDYGVYLLNSNNVLLKNMNITSGSFGILADYCVNLTVTNSTLTSNRYAGLYSYYSSKVAVENSTFEKTTEDSGLIIDACSSWVVKNCRFTDNAIDGLTGWNVTDFTVKDSLFTGNGWGSEIYFASNGIYQNCQMSNNHQAIYGERLNNVTFTANRFSYNGLGQDDGPYTGGVEVANSNCTVSSNVFEGNYDAFLWRTTSTNITGTVNVSSNTFQNNHYTFFFYNQLPSGFSGQKLYFYNNLVNDTAYVDPVCLNATYSGNYLPFNKDALNLNSTLQTGTRIIGSPNKMGGNFWALPNGKGFSQTTQDANHDGFVDAPFDLFDSVSLYGNATLVKIYDYLPYSLNYSTNLAFMAGATQTLTANQSSALITVALRDAYGAVTTGVTFTLTSNSSTAKFYSDPACTQQISSLTIPAGATTNSFYFKDTAAGNPTITASATGVLSATTQFKINQHENAAKSITTSPSTETVTAGTPVTYYTTATDQYGNSWNVSAAYTVNDLEITSNTVTLTQTGTYTVKATYGDFTTTSTITVTPSALDRFVVLASTSATAGSPFEVMVVAIDAYHNIVTSYSGTVTFSSDLGTITPTTSGAFTAGIWDGTVTLMQEGTATITATDGSHSGKSANITLTMPTPTPTATPKPTQKQMIAVTTSSGATINLSMNGNISATQMTGTTLTTNQSTSTTTLSFTVTGESGTTGFTNITIPKSLVTYGNNPTVAIDGAQALDFGFCQDSENYYVWFSTAFSAHNVEIEFSGQATTNAPMPIVWYAVIIAVIIAAAVLFLAVSRRKK